MPVKAKRIKRARNNKISSAISDAVGSQGSATSQSVPASEQTDSEPHAAVEAPVVVKDYFLLIYTDNDQISYEDPLSVLKAIKGLQDFKPGQHNVHVVLHTSGGDTNSAAKIVNILHKNFSSVTVIVPYWAMSAGTLIALGANQIVMPESGQLGPLDTQINHPTQEKTISAIDYTRSLTDIESLAKITASDFYDQIRKDTKRKLSMAEAMRIAYDSATKFVEALTRQVDPIEYSRASRALDVSNDYGRPFLKEYSLRSGLKDDNFASRVIWLFIRGYPSHGFAIFFKQIKDFLNVIEPESYSHWDKVWQEVLPYVEDDCSPKPKKSKTIRFF